MKFPWDAHMRAARRRQRMEEGWGLTEIPGLNRTNIVIVEVDGVLEIGIR